MQAFKPICSQTHTYNLEVNESPVWQQWGGPYDRFADSGLPFVSPSVCRPQSVSPTRTLTEHRLFGGR